MNSLMITTAFFALALAAHAAPMMEPMVPEASAMPNPDPMMPTGPGLYLVQAGTAPYSMGPKKLMAYSTVKVCPANYPHGFSVRCDASTSSSVIFRVDGREFNREYRAPFLLNGDKAGKIFPFRGLQSEADARISCQVRGEKAVWVDLVRQC